MADTVSRLIERTVPELEDLKIRGLFTGDEIRSIVKTRTDFEYRINARAPDKVDYLRYIKYEHTLEALRQKRKARISSDVSSVSDFAGEKRMHFIFSRALKKFQGDLTLWNQYIDFAMKGTSTNRLSKIFPEALRLHPTASQLWIKAAVWEYHHNSNIATARMHMQRAIRLSGNDEHLWIEYFRLELDYVRKVRARRSVLGLSTSSRKTRGGEEEDNGNNDDSNDDDSNDDDSNDDDDDESTSSKKKKKIKGGDVTLEFLKGAVPFIVYSNACSSIGTTNTVEFNMKFLSACGDDFSWLSSSILTKCRTMFDKSEIFWDLYSRLPEKEEERTMISESSGYNDGSDGFDLPEDRKRDADDSVEERAERLLEQVEARYKESLENVSTPLMWTKYLEWKVEEGEEGEDGEDGGVGSSRHTAASVLEAFAAAHKLKCLEPNMYRAWVRQVVRYNQSDDDRDGNDAMSKSSKQQKKRRRTSLSAATPVSSSSSLSSVGAVKGRVTRLTPSLVAERATRAHPRSTVAWKIHISVVQQRLSIRPTKGMEELKILYSKATESVDSKEEDAWELEAGLLELCCHTSKRSTWMHSSKQCLARMRRRHYLESSVLSLLYRCFQWMDMKTCRSLTSYVVKTGEVFATRVPTDVFRTAVAREMREARGNGHECGDEVRSLYEQYVSVHSTRLQAWLEYARFELEFGGVGRISRLTWRAKKALGDSMSSAWESEYAKLKLDIAERRE